MDIRKEADWSLAMFDHYLMTNKSYLDHCEKKDVITEIYSWWKFCVCDYHKRCRSFHKEEVKKNG